MKTHLALFRINKIMVLSILLLTIASCNLIGDLKDPDPVISASAGGDQIVGLTELVTIIGSGSSNDGSTVSFSWTVITKPTGSNLSLANLSESTISFTPDMLGEYIINLTVSVQEGFSESDEVTISVEQLPVLLSGILSNDRTLENVYDDPSVPDYKVSSTYSVNAQLTIKPDVKIVFEANAGLSISTSGSLISKGTSEKNIVFTGVQETSGFWKGIVIDSNDPDNQLEFTTIEYGGSSGFVGPSKLSNILINGAGKLKMSNCTSRESAGYGIFINSLESELVNFKNNILTKNNAPVMASIHHYSYFDEESNYSGNVNNYIDSYRGSEHVSKNASWQALNVPYRLSDGIESIQSDINILAGATFISQSNGGILIKEEGSLSAEGSEGRPIIFSGEEDVPGYWKGLSFLSNTTKNKLAFVKISNGGSDGFDAHHIKSNINVQGSGRLSITNCFSTNSAEFGLSVYNEESVLSEFSHNVFTGNLSPISAKVNHFHFFDSESDYTGNDNDYIMGFQSYNAPTGTLIWKKLNVPYRIPNTFEAIDGDLTINPGVEIISAPDGGIQISEIGSFTAIGTPNENIIFRGEEDVKGFWRGIQIKSQNPNNKIAYTSISGGGKEGFDAGHRKSNLEVVGNLDISFSNLSNCTGYGIRVRKDATITLFENTFSGNDSGDIFYDE